MLIETALISKPAERCSKRHALAGTAAKTSTGIQCHEDALPRRLTGRSTPAALCGPVVVRCTLLRSLSAS